MKILQINKFLYLKGGSERYLFSVSDVLKQNKHDVAFFSMQHPMNASSEWEKYFIPNIKFDKEHNLVEKIKLFFNILYSFVAEHQLSKVLAEFKPEIVHVHNFHHQLSPSILFALRKKNVPVVMTVHDYKMVCPSYNMLNHGSLCELCKDGKFYNCVKTRCFKNSFSKSLIASLECYLHHYVLNSFSSIKCYICPSKFIMQRMQYMGLKGNCVYLPYLIDTDKAKPSNISKKKKIVYWGRLSFEKGLSCVLEAVKGLPVELDVIGEGPMRAELEDKIKIGGIKNVHFLGYLKGQRLFERIEESISAIVSSICYENYPLSVLEAFALGIPVIGSNIGGIPELVKNGITGLLFEPGDYNDLRNKIEYMISHEDKAIEMGRNARVLAEKEYNPQSHYERLMKIYNDAIYP